MRIIISILLLSFVASSSIAQNCDIAQTTGVKIFNAAGTATVTTIQAGQTANFRFTIKNLGTANDCSIPANSVTAVFDFPSLAGGIKPYIYIGPSSFTSGYFTWSYNNDAEVLMGTNTTAIPSGEGDIDITIKVKGYSTGAGNSNLNIGQGKGVADNTANDFSTAKLTVSGTRLLPVNLSGFTSTVDICDVLLSWKTISETDFSHFELEYSADGITFDKIARAEGKSANGADYYFNYAQLSEIGYYRLKEVASDGSYEYSNTIRAKTDCHGKGKILVYPNPVDYAQKLQVNISGYTGKMTGDIYNGTGQKIATYNLTSRTNELSMEKLSAGAYMLKVRNESGEVQSFRIIVTR